MKANEVKKWLTENESVRFKEKATDFLYDVKWLGEDTVIVKQCPPHEDNVQVFSLNTFVEKFDEFYGNTQHSDD